MILEPNAGAPTPTVYVLPTNVPVWLPLVNTKPLPFPLTDTVAFLVDVI